MSDTAMTCSATAKRTRVIDFREWRWGRVMDHLRTDVKEDGDEYHVMGCATPMPKPGDLALKVLNLTDGGKCDGALEFLGVKRMGNPRDGFEALVKVVGIWEDAPETATYYDVV